MLTRSPAARPAPSATRATARLAALLFLTACGLETTGVILEYTATPTRGLAPLQVFFAWRLKAGVLRCGMEFGDGSFVTLEPCPTGVSHSYAAPGTYNAVLTAFAPRDGLDEFLGSPAASDNQRDSLTVEVLPPDTPPVTLSVTIQSVNGGEGEVYSDDADETITCANTSPPAPDCSASFTVGTQVYLLAEAASGSRFDEWQGDCSEVIVGDCRVMMDGDKSVTAVFSKVVSATTIGVDVFDLSGNRQNPLAAAIQVGDGSWTLVTPVSPGRIEYPVPAGEGRVGVMVRCSMDLVRSLHVTLTEADNVRVECENNSAPKVNIGIAWTGVDALIMGATSYSVTVHGAPGTIGSGSGASGATTIPNQPAVLSDLLVAGRVNGVVAGVRLMPNVTLQNGATYSFPFEAADRGGTAQVNPFTVPSGHNGSFLALLASPRAIMDLGFGTNAGGVYYTAPSGMSGVQYLGGAAATAPGSQVTHFQVRAQAMDFAIDLPEPWDTFTPPTVTTFTGLDGSDPDLSNYNFSLVRTSPSPSLSWVGTVTPGWLGTSTSYTVADPSGLAGFEDFAFGNGDDVNYLAEMVRTNLPLSETLNARRVIGIPMLDGIDRRTLVRSGVIQF